VARNLFTGKWSGTMCLTESGAGSSVGDNRARAIPSDEPGVYHLEGEKIFISGGDNDLVENIIHLVLARTPDSPSGTKGLSLFLVPKFMFDADGKLGERNGAKVVGIEHKMGINGSATCTLALGADKPCKGWMVGNEREGIALMFNMMNEARIGVAGQGTAMAGAAYAFAVQYAKDRVQGTKLTKRDSDSERVAITAHPDVRRMLMTLKVVADTTRSACIRLVFLNDIARHTTDEAERARCEQRQDLLIPILKAHCTDLGFEMAALAVQVYGGYGYIGEYPVEQLVRDAKIQSIYEGTNGIQALDLVGRKMRAQGGALFMGWMAEAQGQLAEASAEGFGPQCEAIGKAVGQLGACAMHIGKAAGAGNIDGAFIYAVPLLQTFGTILLAFEALDQARVAKRLIASRGESPLLRGKLLNLDFYVAHMLPRAIATAKTVQSGDESCLDPSLFV
jgi:alkylation response protein AidB-like acyl-CoA dehydrogenase